MNDLSKFVVNLILGTIGIMIVLVLLLPVLALFGAMGGWPMVLLVLGAMAWALWADFKRKQTKRKETIGKTMKCPYCSGVISPTTRVCPHCGGR